MSHLKKSEMTSDIENPTHDLKTTAQDRAFSVAKATLSYVPFAGPALAELISVTIPNQRMDRFAEFMRFMNDRIDLVETILKDEGKHHPERIALIETGTEQSTKARSSERISRIATLVLKGIEQTEQEAMETHRILRLLPQIDDQELLMLLTFGGSGEQRQAAFSALTLPEQLQYRSTDGLRRQHQLFNLGLEHLSSLGLLKPKALDVELVRSRNRRLDGEASLPQLKKRKTERANAHLAMREYSISP